MSDGVWKALDKMGTTSDTFDGVIRKLMKEAGKAHTLEEVEEAGFKGADLVTRLGDRIPNNTELRAPYKKVEYRSIVKNGNMIVNGKKFKSPSMAARSITGYNINGWHFWETKDEKDGKWKQIAALRTRWNADNNG